MADRLGKLFVLGVGPGDPEWLTLRAHRILREAPVVAYPQKMRSGDSYALSIVESLLPTPGPERLGLVFPMTRDPEKLRIQWEETVNRVWEKLSAGRDVAFITEGHPYLYSTAIHLVRLLRRIHPGVEVEVVPGVSSPGGAAARLDIPLADGDERVGIIPAVDDREAMRRALAEHDTVVFLKVAKVMDMMVGLLEELHLVDRAAVVTKCGTPDEQVFWDIRELRGRELEYLTLMIVKKGEQR
ncbi:precorrin-2 C(20)-methyltransferase [Kyrpidia tusciae]|uniref:Precorrin-2 C20-methyltransferase n=1 Tax=Kyrpidia tusciae (strain DSM 2912 / NBRC 15312 / T2) TaxID=562970 RepID=D5WT72_KYRT2|nr:precorrin-2 C(20)-methyltransferase [Kyrpidia tusciae]ADG05176.1 precorrin-2 C20-methyltransferase [Kyrpidia tusciae DSM 2912]